MFPSSTLLILLPVLLTFCCFLSFICFCAYSSYPRIVTYFLPSTLLLHTSPFSPLYQIRLFFQVSFVWMESYPPPAAHLLLILTDPPLISCYWFQKGNPCVIWLVMRAHWWQQPYSLWIPQSDSNIWTQTLKIKTNTYQVVVVHSLENKWSQILKVYETFTYNMNNDDLLL